MPKLTKSPPPSPGRRSFFGSSSTSSLIGPSRPIVQKKPDGRWTIVRVRTPRVDIPDDAELDEARLRREEEDRGYEGMIRPLYLEEGASMCEAGGAVCEFGAEGKRPEVIPAARRSSEAVVPTLSSLQSAMLKPSPPGPSLPSLDTTPPVPPIPDAYRALAPRSPPKNTSPISQRYPLSEYADETACTHSSEHGEGRRYPGHQVYRHKHGDAAREGGQDDAYDTEVKVGEIMPKHMMGRLPFIGDKDGAAGVQAGSSAGSAQVIEPPTRPLPAVPNSAITTSLQGRPLGMPITTELERNPSSSTAKTRASDTDPPTEESARLETPSLGDLLDAEPYRWDGQPGPGIDLQVGSEHVRADFDHSGGVQYSQFGNDTSDNPAAVHANEQQLELYSASAPMLTSHQHGSPASPTTPGPLSRINWEGDLQHKSSFATLATAHGHNYTHGNDRRHNERYSYSHDSSSTVTPTRIPLSAEDNHGDVLRVMRPRAGSTGGQSTAMSLYSIGGFLMYEPRRPSGAGSMLGPDGSRRERRERRNSEGSIASSHLLSPALGREEGVERGKGRVVNTVTMCRSKEAAEGGSRKVRRGVRDTFGPAEADVDVDVHTATSDKDTDAEKESRRRRRSSVRHPYQTPARRAPPPPTFYIEQTPPTSPLSPSVEMPPSTPTTPSRIERMKRFTSASVVSLPAPPSTMHSRDPGAGSAEVGVGLGGLSARTRKLSTPASIAASSRRIRGMTSSSVVSLPSTSMHVDPLPAPPLPVSATSTDSAVKRPSLLLGPPVDGRPQAERSLSVTSTDQGASNEAHAQGLGKYKQRLGKKGSKKVSIGLVAANSPRSARAGDDGVTRDHGKLQAIAQGQQAKAAPATVDTPSRKGALGELWRRMSAGRKGRKSKMVDQPVLGGVRDGPTAHPDQWGSIADTPLKPEARDNDSTPIAVLPTTSKAREIRRKSVPAYHNGKQGELSSLPSTTGNRASLLPRSSTKEERRRSLSAVKITLPTDQKDDPIPKVPLRPSIRISTNPSTTSSAPLPRLPSPLTLANIDALIDTDRSHSTTPKGKRQSSGSPIRSRWRTSSNRHSSRPLSLADRQKEEKRRYRRTLIEIEDDVLFQQVVGDLSRLDVVRPGSLDQAGPSARVGPPFVAADAKASRGPDTDASGNIPMRNKWNAKAEGEGSQSELGPTGPPVAAVHRQRPPMSIVPSAAYDPWYTQSMRHAPASAAVVTARVSEIPDPTTCGVQAWFVMRELVQGERRHGRLLAKGIAISKQVASHLIAAKVESAPVTQRSMVRPTSLVEVTSAKSGDRLSALRSSTFAVFDRSWSSSAQSSSVNLALDAALVVEEPEGMPQSKAKNREGRDEVPMRRSVSFSRITLARNARPDSDPVLPLHAARLNSLPSPGSTTSIDTVRNTGQQSIDILLLRLPRLLALSLTLSSRFAHDPSPDQIATAFLSMEDELTTEMAGWAADVGVLISSGVGKEIDRLRRSSGQASGGRSVSALPANRARSSLPIPSAPGSTDFDTASSKADGAALQALADSTSFMPLMGRAHSYTAIQRAEPRPVTPQVASPTSFGSSLSSFMGFGSSTSKSRTENTNARTRQNSMGDSSHARSHSATQRMPTDGHATPIKEKSAHEQDRSSFSDVIMAPVQRVARYRILFSSLVRKLDESPVPLNSNGNGESDVSLSRAGTSGSHSTSRGGTSESSGKERQTLVRAALEASERVLQAVDAAQAYNLSDLRSPSTAKGKGRSKSRLRVKSRSWAQEKGNDGVKKTDSTGSESSKGSCSGPAVTPAARTTRSALQKCGTTAQDGVQAVEAGIDAAYKRHRTRLAAGGSGLTSKEPTVAQGVKGEHAGDKIQVKERKRRKSKTEQAVLGEAVTGLRDGEAHDMPPSPTLAHDATPTKRELVRDKAKVKQ